MTHPSRLHTDPRSYKLDARFFKRMYSLARPYWVRKGAWRSWIVLTVLLALVAAFSVFGAYFSYLTRDQTNALVARKVPEFWHLLTLSMLYMGVRHGSSILQAYLSGRLNLHWRQWLTTELVDRYLDRRTYYEITIDQQIDNPDQRIQEEVAPFCSIVTAVPFQLIGTVTDISVQAVILMTISKSLFIAVLVFAIIKTLVILRLYQPTIKQHYDITVSEADLRYGLLHVRDNAETVAFYRGEFAERTHILDRLRTAIRKHMVVVLYAIRMALVQNGLSMGWTLLPILFLTPLYFAHEVEYGVIAQGSACAAAVLSSLSVVMNFLPMMTGAVPKVVRLAEIQEKFEELGRARASAADAPRIAFAVGKGIELEDVSVQTPGGEQHLVRDISLKLRPGQHLVIVGRTGVGKSSLLRAMAGLWTRGTGCITMPSPDDALFLPQRPYMILSNLRDQLLYPRRRDDLSDGDLQAILEQVNLGDLAEQHGGFDAEKDWGRVLSLGEQQRIGFARALVAQPRFIFLDEATSAVDVETERLLYGLLARSKATFVSVGHRPTLLDYHITALRLLPKGEWEVVPARRALMDELEGDVRLDEASGLNVA